MSKITTSIRKELDAYDKLSSVLYIELVNGSSKEGSIENIGEDFVCIKCMGDLLKIPFTAIAYFMLKE